MGDVLVRWRLDNTCVLDGKARFRAKGQEDIMPGRTGRQFERFGLVTVLGTTEEMSKARALGAARPGDGAQVEPEQSPNGAEAEPDESPTIAQEEPDQSLGRERQARTRTPHKTRDTEAEDGQEDSHGQA